MLHRRELLRLLPSAFAANARADGSLELRVAKVSARTVRIVLGNPGARIANDGTLLPSALTAGGTGARVPFDSTQPIEVGRTSGLPGGLPGAPWIVRP